MEADEFFKPEEETGEETHEDHDQFFRFEAGEGKVIIDGAEHRVKDGNGVIVPAGARHNVLIPLNSPTLDSTRSTLRLHRDGVVRHTKKDAMTNEEQDEGGATEHFTDMPVEIAVSSVATDTLSLHQRKDITVFEGARKAAYCMGRRRHQIYPRQLEE